jgi:ABC-2 type transport system ATP-binding protein
VVIVDHGSVVLAGDLEDLRAAAPYRVVDVRFRDAVPAMPDWAHLSAVQVLQATDGRIRLKMDRSADIEAVVGEARRAGELVSFAYQPPTLSDLFREAVAA